MLVSRIIIISILEMIFCKLLNDLIVIITPWKWEKLTEVSVWSKRVLADYIMISFPWGLREESNTMHNIKFCESFVLNIQ